MYSLAGKVIEVENETTVVVEFRDKSKVKARKAKEAKVGVNDFISVIGSTQSGVRFEMCGNNKLTMDFAWSRED